MEMAMLKFGGGEDGVVVVPDSLFGRRYNAALIGQTLASIMSNARLGTRKQKTRAETRHSRRKLFRQKGGGRARAGHSSTPLRRGGGRAFPASPDDNFQHKINRKTYRVAMSVVLSRLALEKRIRFVRALTADSHKTGYLVKSLAAMGVAGKVLLIDSECDEKLRLASRNLPNTELLELSIMTLVDLVDADVAIFSERALESMKARWS